MELKDVILSTLAEMEDGSQANNVTPANNFEQRPKEELSEVIITDSEDEIMPEKAAYSEIAFLKSMRERLLVLFEGFQAPNNSNIEAKVDLTLNFLEYVLVTIDARVEEIEKGRR